MTRRQMWPVWALVGWTVFVWGTRIGTIWSDEDLDATAKTGRFALVASFLVLAAAAVLVRPWGSHRWALAVRAFSGWTIGVWLVRMIDIAAGGHDGAFVVAHGVLAAASVVLAVLSWRATLPVRHGTAGHHDRREVEPA